MIHSNKVNLEVMKSLNFCYKKSEQKYKVLFLIYLTLLILSTDLYLFESIIFLVILPVTRGNSYSGFQFVH